MYFIQQQAHAHTYAYKHESTHISDVRGICLTDF